jgi:hypothetical protein
MEINSAIAKGYVMNARNRRHKCEEWSEWLGLMPMGKPITASEVVQLVAEKYGECSLRAPSPQAVSAMLNAVKATGAVMRMEVAIEPYEIEVETRRHWSNKQQCYVEGGMKKITIDKKTVFIRMV